jgi:hypothetical protein
MARELPRHAVVRYWGVAVLVIGLAAAAFVYALAGNDRDAEIAAEISGGRMYQHNLELMGGKLGVVLADVNDWFASLWHGRRLASTIAVISIAAAAACFWVSHLMSFDAPRDSNPSDRD